MWTQAPSAIIDSPEQMLFLDNLQARLSFYPYVTSGTRTPETQARAMFKKIQLGGLEELLKTYSNDNYARDVYAAFPDNAAAAAVIAKYRDKGYGSAHLRGLSVDLRTRDRTEDEIRQMIEASIALGANAEREYTPPHLHITIPAGAAPPAAPALLVPIVIAILGILAANYWGTR